MVDNQFADRDLAALYDLLHPGEPRGDFAFYLPRVLAAGSVLDVGCGTGALLRAARDAGHTGRLCGLDPAEAMLDVARARHDVEWVRGDLGSVRWAGEFDLVVMTGHAFQELVTDAQVHEAFTAVRAALAAGGRFVFETRNPAVRAWEQWIPANGAAVTDPSGATVTMRHQVQLPVDGDLVRFTTTYDSTAWDSPRLSHSTLRFHGTGALASALAAAGLAVVEQFGDWDGTPAAPASPEIITVAGVV